jgi:hypothetical protein
MAEVAGLQGERERLVQLFGAVAQLHTLLGVPPFPAEQVEYERQLSVARAQLGGCAFDTAWAKGQTMTLEQAIADALNAISPAPLLSHLPMSDVMSEERV